MVTTLREIATENSTYIVSVTFTNEDGNAVTPASAVNWRLLDSIGNQISSGQETAAATVTIVLTGASIVVSSTERGLAFLTLVVSTTYDSAAGNGLTLVDTARFQVVNVLDVPP